MGDIHDALNAIDLEQNQILETGKTSEKMHEVFKIYEKIYKIESSDANDQAKILEKDLGNWINKKESYVNPRTAQLIRKRLNERFEIRKKLMEDVRFSKK